MTPEREGDDMSTIADESRTGHRSTSEREAAPSSRMRAGSGADATDAPEPEANRREAGRREAGRREAIAGVPGHDADGPVGPPRWLLAALVAWGLVMSAIAGWSFLRADGVADDRDDRRAAASVAGEFASATMSYDHRDLDGSLAAVTDLATTEYAETYQNAFFEELQPVVDELRARGRVHVRDVYVSDVSDGTATAVVSFDAVIRSTIGTRRLAGSYVRVDLVREGGGWRADDLTFLATTQEGLDGPTGAAGVTTPTTAPG